jgi:hypothetical protein
MIMHNDTNPHLRVAQVEVVHDGRAQHAAQPGQPHALLRREQRLRAVRAAHVLVDGGARGAPGRPARLLIGVGEGEG